MRIRPARNSLRSARSSLKPQAVYRFCKAASEGNTLFLFDESAKDASAAPLAQIEFPRQAKLEELCISDYVVPRSEAGRYGLDTISMFCTTAGGGIRERSEHYKVTGEYLKSHAIAAL